MHEEQQRTINNSRNVRNWAEAGRKINIDPMSSFFKKLTGLSMELPKMR